MYFFQTRNYQEILKNQAINGYLLGGSSGWKFGTRRLLARSSLPKLFVKR